MIDRTHWFGGNGRDAGSRPHALLVLATNGRWQPAKSLFEYVQQKVIETCASAIEDEAARKKAMAAKAKAAAERARRLFSVFGAAPDGMHAPMDHEHPLARGKAAKRSDDAAALSPRRRRAYEMDCGWRLEDQERMGQLARALVDRRTPLAGALARADQQDEEVKVEKKAEAKRWR